MSDTKLIRELFDYEFNIPYYQRGYKWEEQEVNELLDDIWEFYLNASPGEFYCLQPIVVKLTGENQYDVIDGQQRLTTIYLLLHYLKDKIEEEHYPSNFFQLKYATRINSESFIGEQKFKHGINEDNVDFYHMSKAYDTIDEWFKKTSGAKGKITNVLLDEDNGCDKNVKFIWYVLGDDESPIDAFIRLNVGKIQLTDAELIKALLFQLDKYSDKDKIIIEKDLEKIANEWDKIEYKLQEEEFWFFINDIKNTYPTHIEFIFNLIADQILRYEEFAVIKKSKFKNEKPTKYGIFLIINEWLKILMGDKPQSKDRLNAIEEFWDKVVLYFENFNEWFNNRKLFHYIGYLIAINKNTSIIDDLMEKNSTMNKDEFEKELISLVQKTVDFQNVMKNENGTYELKKIEHYSYEDDALEIQKLLLLHNVITTLNSDKEMAKFPFHLYKRTQNSEKWTLEHIHAQNSDVISKTEHQIEWLNDHLELLNIKIPESELIQRIEEYLDGKNKDIKFEKLYKEVLEILDPQKDESKKHLIENLCLLDGRTNSSLNKSVFEIKRSKIRKRELEGNYIPICSRNVFLKTYTNYPKNNSYWDDLDKEEYLKNIKTILQDFLPKHF